MTIARVIPPGTWFCLYRIEFSDGGPPQIGALHEGTEAECWAVYNAVPAVNYDGPRVPRTCTMGVFPHD